MRPRRFILPQAGTGGYGIRPYFFCGDGEGHVFPCCVCRGDHWSPVNLPPQRIFRDSFLVRQAGTGEQCSPLQMFFDSLSPKYSCPPHGSLPHRLRAEPPRRGGQERAVPRVEFSPFVGNVIRRGAFYMRPRKFILPQAGTGGYGIRPYVFEAAKHQPSRDRVEVFLHGAYLRRLRQALVQRQNAQGAKLQQQSHAQHGCKYLLCFHLVLLMYRKQPGRSKPPGFKAMQLLFVFFAPQQHKQHGRAQRQHQQKRGPGGIAGLRNTECGRGGLRRGHGGRRFTGRRLRAYRRGNCAGLQRGQQTVVLKLRHKERKQRQGKRVFSWVISPILYNSLLNSLYRCVLLYIRHGHNIGPVHGAAVLQRGRCDARPPRPLLR